jgi:hypothetical protein
MAMFMVYAYCHIPYVMLFSALKKIKFLRLQNFYFTLFKNSVCFLRSIKVNVKVNLEQAMKAQKGSRDIALRYL